MRPMFAVLAVVSGFFWGLVVIQGAEAPSWLGSSALLASVSALGLAVIGLRGRGRRIRRRAEEGSSWPGALSFRNEARFWPFAAVDLPLAVLAVVVGSGGREPGSIGVRVLAPAVLAFHLGTLGLGWISLTAQGRLLAEARSRAGLGGERR